MKKCNKCGLTKRPAQKGKNIRTSKACSCVAKNYTEEESIDILVKSMYKMVEKAYKAKVDTINSKVVQDVLDADDKAEVDPDSIPTAKPSVLWKKDPKAKGVNKLKSFVKGKNK